ncbi:transposase [Streptomyces sp. NPDC085540]|uniref:transposase n=1 Tax=Streptomyces sp. NPDC085540 TaxID=3365730 RepID=UPI0037D081DE
MTDAQRAVLEGWSRRRKTAQALAQRSRIVLEYAEGHSMMEVSRRLGIAPDTVRTWRREFLEHGLDGLGDEPRPGVPRKIPDADVERVIVKALTLPTAAATVAERLRHPARPRFERGPEAAHMVGVDVANALGRGESAGDRYSDGHCLLVKLPVSTSS